MFYIMLFRKDNATKYFLGYVCHPGTDETILFAERETAQLSANTFKKNGVIAEVRATW